MIAESFDPLIFEEIYLQWKMSLFLLLLEKPVHPETEEMSV